MARQKANVIQNTFVKGLITESTGLKFPEDACTETWNCFFDETGRITRRPGLDYETGAVTQSLANQTNPAYTEFTWEACGGDGSVSYLVIQRGNTIEFYNTSTVVATLADEKSSFTITLSSFVPSGSSYAPLDYPCQYTQGAGYLVIVNKAIPPLAVLYKNGELSVEQIDIKIRDLEGVDSGYPATFRPSLSVAQLLTANPNHYYNLLNQGWAHTDALAQWDASSLLLPSSADIPALYRVSAADSFDITYVGAKAPGNIEAAKGHFILSPYNPNRTAALVAEGFTGATVVEDFELVDYTGSSNIDNGVTNEANAFDDNFVTEATVTAGADRYLGKTLGTASSVQRAVITIASGSSETITATLYGKTGAAPADHTDGTSLGSTSFNPFGYTSGLGSGVGSGATVTIISSDVATTWDHIWVDFGTPLNDFVISEQVYYSTSSTVADITYSRPTTTAFFAGRVWYAGVGGLGLNSSIFFSQIIENKKQLGYCYSANDPTSEEASDLLASDGGALKIPEISNIVRLETFQSSLIVFASNGVWEISGSGKNYFQATDYSVRKLTDVGTNSPLSFVKFKGLPVWWGDDGINALTFDPQYGSFQVTSLTDTTIYSFLQDIPSLNRNYVKGEFDPDANIAYFLYNDTASLTSANYYSYNKVLVFNGLAKSFFPWSLDTTGGTIRGITYCRTPGRTVEPKLKVITTLVSGGNTLLKMAEFSNVTSWEDWPTVGGGVSYTSYFISGYSLHGETNRKSQPNYVFVFLENQTDASCYMQSIYDWTNSSGSGKWSTSQQVYNVSQTLRNVNVSRLKVRGQGRSLQFKFESEANKPFTIIGWSFRETISGDI